MAKIAVYKNIFNSSDVERYETSGVSVRELIEDACRDDIDTSVVAETYNADTGETEYAALPVGDTLNVSVCVNGEEKDADYIVKEADSVVVVVLPASNAEDASTALKITGGVLAVAGLLAAVILSAGAAGVAASLGGTLSSETWMWIVGTGAVGIVGVGMVHAGFELQRGADDARNNRKSGDIDAEKLPEIKGSENQSIIGNTIPLVTGDINVTPFVVGSPVSHLDEPTEVKTGTGVAEIEWEIEVEHRSIYSKGSSVLVWSTRFISQVFTPNYIKCTRPVAADTWVWISTIGYRVVRYHSTVIQSRTLEVNTKLPFLLKAGRNMLSYAEIISQIMDLSGREPTCYEEQVLKTYIISHPFGFMDYWKYSVSNEPVILWDFWPKNDTLYDETGLLFTVGFEPDSEFVEECGTDLSGVYDGHAFLRTTSSGVFKEYRNNWLEKTLSEVKENRCKQEITVSSAISDENLSRIFGNKQRIDLLLGLGYAPLAVRNIAFDGLKVAGNPNNVIAGKMACSTDANGDADSTTDLLTKYGETQTFNGKDLKREIETTWTVNKPEFEINQLGVQGDIYRFVEKQEFMDCPLLYCYDDAYTAIAKEKSISWQGGSFQVGYRNTVKKFSASLPRKITVGFEFPSGLYSENAGSDDSDKHTYFKKIPMNVVVQWRPRYKYVDSGAGATTADEETSAVYDTAGKPYDETRYGRWRNFDDGIVRKIKYNTSSSKYTYWNFSGNPVVKASGGTEYYGCIISSEELLTCPSGLSGDTWHFEESETTNVLSEPRSKYVTRRAEEIAKDKHYIYTDHREETRYILWLIPYTYRYDVNVDEYHGNPSRVAECKALAEAEIVAMETARRSKYANMENTVETFENVNTVSSMEVKRNVGLSDNTSYNCNPTWNGVMAFSFGPFSCGKQAYSGNQYDPSFDEEHDTFPDQIGVKDGMRFEISAELDQEDILDLLNRNPKSIALDKSGTGLNGQTSVVFDSVEVRIVRLTPCYVDGYFKVGEKDIQKKYTDVIKVTYIRTECLDKDKLLRDIDYIQNGMDSPVIDCREDTYLTSGTWNTWSTGDYLLKPMSDDDAGKMTTLGVRAWADSLGYIQNQLKKTSLDVSAVSPAYMKSHVRYWYVTSDSPAKYYWYDSYNDFSDQTAFEEGLYVHPEYNPVTWTESTYEEYTAASPSALTGHSGYWWEQKDNAWDRMVLPAAVERQQSVEPMLDVNGEIKTKDDGEYLFRTETTGNNWVRQMRELLAGNKDSLGRVIAPDAFLEAFMGQNAVSQALLVAISPALGKDALGYNSTSHKKFITYWQYAGDSSCQVWDSTDTSPRTAAWFGDTDNTETITWDNASVSGFRSAAKTLIQSETVEGVPDAGLYWSWRDSTGDVNMLALKEAMDYTDAIDVGNGELRYKSNRYIYKAQKFENVLSNALTNARGFWFYDDSGRIEIHNDRPLKNPVLLINDENSISSSNTRSFSKGIAGYHVTFNDEENGGKQGEIYVLRNGQTKDSHTRDIVELSLDGVTNALQARDFALYMLAQTISQREMWTRKLNHVGGALTIGSLVEVQSSSLKIGTDTGARVMRLIEDDLLIYGFLTDKTYMYLGDYDGDGRNRQGCVIMQSDAHVDSRVVRIRLASEAQQEDGITDGYGNTYKNIPAMTNMVLFEKPVIKATDRQQGQTEEDGHYLGTMFAPEEGDVVGFGDMDIMTSLAIVQSITPDEKGCVSVQMYPYYESVYTAAKGLPVYSANLSRRTTSAPPEVRSTVTRSEMNTQLTELASSLDLTGINWLGDLVNPPQNPLINDAYYNTSLKKSFIWDGTQWSVLTIDGDSPTVAISTSGKEHTITITDVNHPQGQEFVVRDGESGTGYRIDLSPEQTTLLNTFVSEDGASFQIKASLFYDIEDLHATTTFVARINGTAVGTWTDASDGKIVTIPCTALSTTSDLTSITITATNGEVVREAIANVTIVYSGQDATMYKMLFSATNIKEDAAGERSPSEINVRKRKVNSNGESDTERCYITVSVDGGNEQKTNCYDSAKDTQYDSTKTYYEKVSPFFLYTDSNNNYVLGNGMNASGTAVVGGVFYN